MAVLFHKICAECKDPVFREFKSAFGEPKQAPIIPLNDSLSTQGWSQYSICRTGDHGTSLEFPVTLSQGFRWNVHGGISYDGILWERTSSNHRALQLFDL